MLKLQESWSWTQDSTLSLLPQASCQVKNYTGISLPTLYTVAKLENHPFTKTICDEFSFSQFIYYERFECIFLLAKLVKTKLNLLIFCEKQFQQLFLCVVPVWVLKGFSAVGNTARPAAIARQRQAADKFDLYYLKVFPASCTITTVLRRTATAARNHKTALTMLCRSNSSKACR